MHGFLAVAIVSLPVGAFGATYKKPQPKITEGTALRDVQRE